LGEFLAAFQEMGVGFGQTGVWEFGGHQLANPNLKKQKEMHQPGIEPGAPAWQAEILPLNHWYLYVYMCKISCIFYTKWLCNALSVSTKLKYAFRTSIIIERGT
jgi:hypothetical protein